MKYTFVLMVLICLISGQCQKQDDKVTSSNSGILNYEIIDEIKLMSGEMMGEVLISSFSRNTPASERERVIREIAKKKNYDRVDLYCTVDAQKANYSDSYSTQHPDALRNGFLGSLRDGKFTPGEELYP